MVYAFLVILLPLVSSCVTVQSTDNGIWVTGISESLTRYYIPATTWTEKTNRYVTCRLDMTYIDEHGKPVVCNISFFNKDTIPKDVTSISFMAGSEFYHLDDVKIMFTRAEYKELRITSVMEIDKLLNIFQSEKILLIAIINSVEYTFVPDKEFMNYTKQFYNRLTQR
jgi:hypothetical protein